MAGWHAARVPRGWVAGADRGQPGQGGTVAWAVHAGHVVTAVQAEAAGRVIEAALDGEPQAAPFHVLVRQAQREMLRLVPLREAGRTG